MTDVATITLRRVNGWVYRLRKFHIVIDSQKVGSIGNGQEEVIQVPPGDHQIELRVSWIIKSQVIPLQLKAGDCVCLKCGTPLKFWYFLPSVFIFVMLLNKNLVRLLPLGGLIGLIILCLGIGIYYLQLFLEEINLSIYRQKLTDISNPISY